jgi:hypothetical protein
MSALRVDLGSPSSPGGRKRTNSNPSKPKRLSWDKEVKQPDGTPTSPISQSKIRILNELAEALAQWINANSDRIFVDIQIPSFHQDPNDFLDALQNGYVLLRFAQLAFPQVFESLHIHVHTNVEPFSLLSRENLSAVQFVLSAALKPEDPDERAYDLFSPDLLVERSGDAIVLYCLLKMARVISLQYFNTQPPHSNLTFSDLKFEKASPHRSRSADIYLETPPQDLWQQLSTIEERSGEIEGFGGGSEYDRVLDIKEDIPESKEEWSIVVDVKVDPPVKSRRESKTSGKPSESMISNLYSEPIKKDAIDVTLNERRALANSRPVTSVCFVWALTNFRIRVSTIRRSLKL